MILATSSALSTSNQFVKYTITITQNSQSIENNTSNVTVSVRFYRTNTGYTTYGTGTLYVKINGTTYQQSVTPNDEIKNSGIVLFTKTLNIAHNADGAKTLTCSAWISHNAPLTSSEQSYSQVLTTIPRKSGLTTGNGTLGTAQTLTVDRKSSSFTHTITYKCGSATGTVCSKSSNTSVSFTPPLSLASQNTTGTSVSVVLTIETFNGSTSIGTNSKTITCTIPASVKPTVSIAVSDAAGYLNTYGGYVQGLSKFAITVTESGIYGSSIKTRTTTADGKSYTTASITTGVISGTGSLTITTTVTDSRGRTATASKSVTVLPYAMPKITALNVYRSDASGTAKNSGGYIAVKFSAAITSLNSKNTAAYKVQYKKTSATSYSSATLSNYAGNYSVTNGVYVFSAETSSSYDVVLTATDAFSSATKASTGSSIAKLFSWGTEIFGIAFGKVCEFANTFEVAFATKLTGGVTGDLNMNDGVIHDKYGQAIQNGLAAYTGSLAAGIDPNTTLEHLCLTDRNTPETGFWYVTTLFYAGKSANVNRAQVAVPYNAGKSTYLRYMHEGTWSAWRAQPIVAEEGTSGSYRYRKWANGFVELWGSISVSNAACTTALGNMYRTAALTLSNYPFTVTNPNVQASYESDGYGAFLWATTKATTTTPPNFYLVRPTSATIGSGKINLYITGTWS